MVDLFTPAELATLLGDDDLDVDQALLAHALAAGLITAHTGPLGPATSTATLPVDYDGTVRLPFDVVRSVDAVVGASEWSWEKPFPRLRVCPTSTEPWVTVDVTVTYGTDEVPAVVKAVALSVASRALLNPTGAVSESVDDYSVTHAGTGEAPAGLSLTQAELDALGSLADTAYVTG